MALQRSRAKGFGKGGRKGGTMFPRRRKKWKRPPGHPTDAELVASFLEKNPNGITKCPDGVAIGSMPHSCNGLD